MNRPAEQVYAPTPFEQEYERVIRERDGAEYRIVMLQNTIDTYRRKALAAEHHADHTRHWRDAWAAAAMLFLAILVYQCFR